MAETVELAKLLAQRLMAITGIFPTGSHPSQSDMLASLGVEAKFKSRAKRWLSAPDKDDYSRAKFESPEAPDAKRLQEKLLKPIAGDEETAIRSAFDDPMEGEEYLAAVRNARAYIDSKWPKIPVPGAVAEVFPLSNEELEDVWALVRVADDPEIMFNELESESLSIQMIDCLRACYPDLFSEMLTMIDGLVIERVAADKKLTWQQQDLLHMLHGTDLETPIEIAKPQQKQPTQQQGGNQ